jgi:hypothetical protein
MRGVDSFPTAKEAHQCWKQLCDHGIVDSKSWRAWNLVNHPDRRGKITKREIALHNKLSGCWSTWSSGFPQKKGIVPCPPPAMKKSPRPARRVLLIRSARKPRIPGVGSKRDVYNGKARQTPGGLIKKDLMKNKNGKIVSKKKHAAGLRAVDNLLSAVSKKGGRYFAASRPRRTFIQ